MPAFRNVGPHRISGRLGKHIPVVYDKEGWPLPESVNTLSHQAIKHEPVEISISQFKSLSPIPYTVVDGATHQLSEELKYSSPSEVSLYPDPAQLVDLPLRRNSHTRRRDPGHVPRPRNAFIFFRSHFISSASASGEGQQNELSKHAGKVWNKMSPEDKKPYTEMAVAEKLQHAILHPNYIYAPGRGNSKGKAKGSARKVNGSAMLQKGKAQQKQWSRSSVTSSEPQSPDLSIPPPPRSARAPRAAARRAAQRIVHFPSSSPSPRLLPTPDDHSMAEDSSSGRSDSPEDDFVSTADIPILELSPSLSVGRDEAKPEEPTFYVPELPSSIEYQQEQFGFKPYLLPAAINASLPPLPNSPLSWGCYNNVFGPALIPLPPSPVNVQYSTSMQPLFVSKDEHPTNFQPASQFSTQSTLFNDTTMGHAGPSYSDDFSNLFNAPFPDMMSSNDVTSIDQYFNFDHFP